MSNLVQQLMDEHIHLPGVPQVVVTRGFAYQWLKRAGMDPKARGIGSLDYMVFASPKTSATLTDLETVSSFLAAVQDDMRKYLECA